MTQDKDKSDACFVETVLHILLKTERMEASAVPSEKACSTERCPHEKRMNIWSTVILGDISPIYPRSLAEWKSQQQFKAVWFD